MRQTIDEATAAIIEFVPWEQVPHRTASLVLATLTGSGSGLDSSPHPNPNQVPHRYPALFGDALGARMPMEA